MTMRCHSYTWHTVQSYNNEVSFLYLTHSPSYDNEVSFLYLSLNPVLWQWSVIPILDTQSILMTMRCHSYTWHSAPFLWQWVVIAILDTQSSLNTFACKIWRHLVLRNIKVLKQMKVCPLEPMLNFGHP